MKKYIYLTAVSSLFVLGACADDFLETEPYTEQVIENFYKTPEDAKDHFGLLTAQKEKELKELDYKLKEQAIKASI